MIANEGLTIKIVDNSYNMLREQGYVGFADYYLQACWDQSEFEKKVDNYIYKVLFEKVDSKLGTTQSEQLFSCVYHSAPMDLIKV